MQTRFLVPGALRRVVWQHTARRVQQRSIHVDCIEKGTNGEQTKYQAALFIDNVFPLKMSRLDIRPYLVLRNAGAMRKKVQGLLPELPHGASISDIDPHFRDGGSLVHFTFEAGSGLEAARDKAQGVVDAVNTHVQTHSKQRWLGLATRAMAVRGVPFCEDIVRMLPSKRVRVEFCGPALGVEQVYGEFRPYGRILDIEMPSGADAARWAVVHYTRLRGATSARNCVHGDVVGTTKLLLAYVRENREHVAVQWVKDHSKFMIPLAAAALIAAIYAVFDPVREFCVENKITHRFDLSHVPLLGDVRRAAMRSLLRRDSAPQQDMSAWSGLTDQSSRLASILDEPPESFVVVSGPRGSGKTRVVEQATAGKKYRIVVDARKLAAEHSDLEQMTQLARQLGWWPVFNSIISITNAMDMMVKATTGSNAGISATPESQVRRILETLALALANIRQRRLQSQAHEHEHRSFSESVHTVPSADIPVIVLDNFMDKSIAFTPVILDWAASVVEAGLAHCVITTSSISGYHEVQRAQPQSPASLVSLADASPIEAISLLQHQLAPPELLQQKSTDAHSVESAESYAQRLDTASSDSIANAAQVLGGRLEDLQLFVQKVRAGESVDAALEDIVQRSITEVRKYAFADDSEVGQCEHTWSPEQFWFLLTELAQHQDVEYDRVRSSALFAGKDDALLGLAEAQLITMVYNNDRPSRIRAGRPVYAAAFTRILEDPGFASSMTVKMNKKFIGLETAKIREAEDELAVLNVFRASVEAQSALTSGMAIVAASHGYKGRDKGRGGLSPEAYVAQVAGASARNQGSELMHDRPQESWSSWVRSFFYSSPHAPHTTDVIGVQPSVIPGVPVELQGRVQFLLRTIHSSQQKIDRWDAETQEQVRRLASL
ncbi:mitochondrial escape protein 2 [Coemansia sp. RSA 1822]|nr:mitochondrial escape protein 2 [Coemansia sp. RSA 638]KAJ2544449.1 mitochondrial escape protein 2 [Coemansia sp. RSA 1853]KAJ2566223.1 mitochondrial escape protein 2 [Coemansia sp. RSA 1822]